MLLEQSSRISSALVCSQYQLEKARFKHEKYKEEWGKIIFIIKGESYICLLSGPG